MTFAQIGKLRLNDIIKLNVYKIVKDGTDETSDLFYHEDISKGMAIEYRCSNDDEKDNYIVIGWVRVDKDGETSLESVGDRWFEYVDKDNIDHAKFLYYHAKELIAKRLQEMREE